jgi:chromosome transmission fidelity protein 1
LQQLSIYFARFRTRLSATHALHLKRLVTLLKELQAYGMQWKVESLKKDKTAESKQEVITVGELISRLGRKVEGVNLLQVNAYLRLSKVNVYGHCVRKKGPDVVLHSLRAKSADTLTSWLRRR